jgi:hypothetical protein
MARGAFRVGRAAARRARHGERVLPNAVAGRAAFHAWR